ncbi:unnamed protein product [Amoebophrya sp. A25]|nr:unnamed protein product [Amoebophrya sp. A25]|eukprot:GSA25T00022795001.1
MASPILQLSPTKEIVFTGTNFADKTHSTELKLTNLSNGNVAFKVKTTALKAYLVRPSSNILKAGESVDVQIMLQRLSEVPPNSKHRFLVQAVETTESSLDSRESWAELVKDKAVTEFRLSVVFPDVNGTSGDAAAEGRTQYSTSGGSRDIQSRYDELSEYTKALTERKSELERDIKALKSGSGGKKGYQLFHVAIAIGVALVLVKAAEHFLSGSSGTPVVSVTTPPATAKTAKKAPAAKTDPSEPELTVK